ncbi:MAG: DNA cytosine methyltransferase [Rhodomicrobium sp.]
MPRPIAIDLFAGAGGLSLGLEQAGFDVAAAVEIDPVHAAVHKFNFPQTTVIASSVDGLTGPEIRKAANLGKKRIDLVAGGAPCQGFSLIGHRALDDPRNSLVKEFVRLVKELDASYFLFENVKGLTVGKHRSFLEEVIAAFDEAGYAVRTPWRVLNAADYGVPQNRERLFLLGSKKGLRLPGYPDPICRSAGLPAAALGLPLGPNCRDALDDLPDAERFDILNKCDSVVTAAWGEPSHYAKRMRCLEREAWGYGYVREWDSGVLTSSMRSEHTDISRGRFAHTREGDTEPISRFFKLPSNGVSNTLRAGTDSARGAFTSPRPIHYKYARCITVREMARLHGFPDWFRLHATKWHGARQVGNAVPPPLAKEVGSAVLAAIGIEPARPRKRVELGDPSLLELGMAEAAELAGIAVPIGRRDRKSGAKKRKQWEIEEARKRAA